MGAAVLLVEADDVDHADLVHGLGDQADLGADQVLASTAPRRQERHLHRAVGRQLGVDQLLDPWPEPLGQRVELEVHAGRRRLHVPPGDRHAPLVPDHAAQHVQRRVGPHQRWRRSQSTRPWTVAPVGKVGALDRVPHGRRLAERTSTTVASLRRARRCRGVGRGRSGRRPSGRGRPGASSGPPDDRGVESGQVGVTQVQQLVAIRPSWPGGAPRSAVGPSRWPARTSRRLGSRGQGPA